MNIVPPILGKGDVDSIATAVRCNRKRLQCGATRD
jgi:hypothetical protein